MKVESGFIPLDHDLNFGLGRGLEIDVGFVFARRFLTQFVPRMFRVRNVLGGMVAAFLVLSAAVGWAQVKRVIGFHVRL